MYIDLATLAAIGGAFVTLAGAIGTAIGIAFGKLWNDNRKAHATVAEMLRLQLSDNDKRRDLWDKVREVIGLNTDAIKDMRRDIEWQRAEITRLAARIP